MFGLIEEFTSFKVTLHLNQGVAAKGHIDQKSKFE